MSNIRVMTLDDYDILVELMRQTPGISLRDADSREATTRYLLRNPGLSFVAEQDGQICACIMSGHDGRRGYLQHLLVLPAWRRRGIGEALVQRCISALEGEGIAKFHLDVLKGNALAASFWQAQGWQLREDIDRYSFTRPGNDNA